MANPYLAKFVADMVDEREYQAAKWSDEFDSKNTPNDWTAYIAKYLGRTVTMPWDGEVFRKMLVKVATICAAAAEWCDRGAGTLPRRHYD